MKAVSPPEALEEFDDGAVCVGASVSESRPRPNGVIAIGKCTKGLHSLIRRQHPDSSAPHSRAGVIEPLDHYPERGPPSDTQCHNGQHPHPILGVVHVRLKPLLNGGSVQPTSLGLQAQVVETQQRPLQSHRMPCS